MSDFSLSDTLRSLASKLDSVQEALGGSAPAAWPPYATVNSTVPVPVPQISSSNTLILQKLESLSQELNQLKQSVAQIRSQSFNSSILPLNPMHGIEIVPKREVVVPEIHSLSVADRLLLNRDAKKALEAEEMGASRDDEYPLGEEDEESVSEMQQPHSDMEVEAEGEAEAEAEAEAETEAEAEEEEEEVEEEDGIELEPFEYKGSTYYRDPTTNNVFGEDEDGEVNTEQPIGLWDAEKNRIRVYR